MLYPKVYQDFTEHARTYSDTSVLPTPVFFYGQDIGEEISVDIERGKTLIIRFLTISEPHAGIPVRRMPFLMMEKSSPSVNSWVRRRRMSGALG